VARLGSKVPDYTLVDDEPNLLTFSMVEFEIVCRANSVLQSCWPDSGKSDYPVCDSGWSSFLCPLTSALSSLYLAMRISKVAFGWHCGLPPPPFVLLPLAILQTFRLDHPQQPFFSYDDLHSLGHLGLRWPNRDLPLELDHIHIHRERVLVELRLGTFRKFQSSFVYGRLNLSMENIAIISSLRIRIMPFAIRMLFELF
jgi:hypothetical protein